MKLLILVLAFTLGGCGLLERKQSREQVPQEQQSEVNIGVGYVMLTQVYYMTADAVRSGLLNKQEGQRFLKLLDNANKVLDTAAQMHFSGVEGAARKGMDATDLILNELRNELELKAKQRALKGGK